jgi:hypothetical protein
MCLKFYILNRNANQFLKPLSLDQVDGFKNEKQKATIFPYVFKIPKKLGV